MRLTDETAKRLLKEEEERRKSSKQRGQGRSRIRELEDVSAPYRFKTPFPQSYCTLRPLQVFCRQGAGYSSLMF